MTIQIDIDDKVLVEMDDNIRVLHQNREMVLRNGFLDIAAKLRREAEVAAEYRAAYQKHPQTDEEVAEWAEVQDWGEDWKDA